MSLVSAFLGHGVQKCTKLCKIAKLQNFIQLSLTLTKSGEFLHFTRNTRKSTISPQ